MKTLKTMFMALTVAGLAACHADQSRDFISGTFVSSAIGEFSKADDTLIIESAASNNFLLHRRTGYNLIREGVTGKRQYEREEWQAVYDESTKTLSEIKKGKLITVYPDSGYIRIGKRKYIKK
ncbi:hypothetical protein DHW03_15435 [Pedobacter yonginense]|uniref:Lipoprotein n=1 Tax=Pedobacter yonginense TaxID=651869 RepID=A0A317ELM6_9SPHI|nr:hypothetical protein [Pedobacter yonginense]PWS26186.1 hypothetical protein DHW03_15435 [Pedobacter yonginense]